MAHLVDCPECAQKLRVPEELLGSLVKCPKCGQTFRTEELEATETAGPAPRSMPETATESGTGAAVPSGVPAQVRRAGLEPHRGALILILGILSMATGLGLIFGPSAWMMGAADMRAIRERRMDPAGEALTQAGVICGIIGTLGCGPCCSLSCCGGIIFLLSQG